jgi:CRP-like cAMP-binding protein
MRHLLEQHSRLSLNVLRSVSERLQALRLQYRQLATEKVERRIARALLKLVERAGTRVDDGVLLDLPLSREDVAQLTGTTVFTVSRIISRWETSGVLRAGRQQLIIRRPHALASIADDIS